MRRIQDQDRHVPGVHSGSCLGRPGAQDALTHPDGQRSLRGNGKQASPKEGRTAKTAAGLESVILVKGAFPRGLCKGWLLLIRQALAQMSPRVGFS